MSDNDVVAVSIFAGAAVIGVAIVLSSDKGDPSPVDWAAEHAAAQEVFAAAGSTILDMVDQFGWFLWLLLLPAVILLAVKIACKVAFGVHSWHSIQVKLGESNGADGADDVRPRETL